MMKAYNYYNARRLTIASTGARQASFSSFFECHVPRPVMQSVKRTRGYRSGNSANEFEIEKRAAGCGMLQGGRRLTITCSVAR
jgi:hypothetical protein